MTSVTDIIRNAASGYGVDPAALQAIARIESNNNPDASNPSGAAGLFQFMPGTAQQYGLDNPYDAESSADAAARLARDNGAALERRLGREPTAGELYLAHQQGLGGASALLGNPDTSAVDVLEGVYGSRNRAEHAITQNGGNLGMTASQFANRWIEPANQYYNSYAGQAPASGGGAFDPTGGIVPGVPQPNLPAPAPLTAPSQGGGFNLGSMLSGGLNFLGGQAQQLGGEIGNVASKVPLPSQQQVVQAIMASPSARGAIIDPMIASMFTDKRGTISTNPNKYGSTPQERQYNAARREALANGGPLPSQGVTAVATALSTRPAAAPQQGGGGGGGDGGNGGGGGGTITGSSTGRAYNVGQVYSNNNGSYMATENGFKRL